MDERERQLQQNVIAAALELAAATGTHGFMIPVPDTSPQLYVSLHEGPVKLGLEDQPLPGFERP